MPLKSHVSQEIEKLRLVMFAKCVNLEQNQMKTKLSVLHLHVVKEQQLVNKVNVKNVQNILSQMTWKKIVLLQHVLMIRLSISKENAKVVKQVYSHLVIWDLVSS